MTSVLTKTQKGIKTTKFSKKLFHLIQAPFLLINGQNEESFMYFEMNHFILI